MNRALLIAVPLLLAVAAGAFVVLAAGAQDRPYKAYAPVVASGEKTPIPTAPPTPVPTETPYSGPIHAIYLGSAALDTSGNFEYRGTYFIGDTEVFEDPSHPAWIAHYSDINGLSVAPGFRAGHTVLAAHVNYFNYGNGPFAYLTSASPGDALYLTMANGIEYAYTVKSVQHVPLADIEGIEDYWESFIYPTLEPHTERVTLISCGGTFIPNPGGGGEYLGRIVLIAERWVP